jgi:SAM-dependent MidA family methyltransferase
MRESFRGFMQRALYHPQRGYYTARVKTVGARGDFSTSATLSSQLGCAIGRWLLHEVRRLGIRTVIEVGPGDGSLMRQVRGELGWWWRWRLKFFLVEKSARLTLVQKELLGAGKARWFEELPAALAACNGRALIYHNELMDAFPVDLVQWDAGRGQWRYVELEDGEGGMKEVLGAVAADPDYSVLHTGTDRLGVRAELHSALREWLEGWLPLWQSGSMLCIDYGDLLPGLYYRRPRGTLRAYLLQQRIEGGGVYENVGRQDITADVNFTDVRAWLTELGCTERGYETQAEFLARWLKAEPQGMADPAGAGGAFKCLAVQR